MPLIRLLSSACLGLLCLILNGAQADTNASTHPVILVGGSLDGLHDTSITDAEIGFKLIFNELLAEAKEHFIIKIYDSTDDLLHDFKTGKIQGLFLSSLRFLELGEFVHPRGRYVVQYGPNIKQRYLILVHNKHKGESLSRLRNHKLSLAAGHSIGKRILDVMLLEKGLPESDRFFSEIVQSKEANATIIDLFFGKIDVAMIPEYSYELACELNPQISASLSVLATSEPIIYQAVGMRYDFPLERLNRIEPYIMQLNPSKRLTQLFETFRINGLHYLDDETLQEVRELNERYHRLIQQTP